MIGEVSVVIPVYNESSTLSRVISSIQNVLEGIDIKKEIIVVEDGSDDDTLESISNIRDIVVIRHDMNRGYGAVFLKGIRYSSFKYILIVDADGTYPAEDIPVFFMKIETADMLVGVRQGQQALGSFVRRCGRDVIRRLANYLVGCQIPDLNSGMRLMKKDVVLKFQNLLPQNFSFTTTITLAMLCNHYHVKYIPINYAMRVSGKSKIKPFRDILNFIQLIVRTVMYFNPLKIFIPISLNRFTSK